MNFKYKQVALGGTFDFLHAGHKALINKAFEVGGVVVIGLTTDKFNKARAQPSFENQVQRYRNLKLFLEKNFKKKFKIIWLNDVFGIILKDSKFEAIIATTANLKIVQSINEKRLKNKLNKLEIIKCDLKKDEEGKIISSTRIERGQVDPLGRSYKKLLLKIAGKKLSGGVRNELKKPWGKIININSPHALDPKPYTLISVGDVVTRNLLKAKITPRLAVIDYKVNREGVSAWIKANIKVSNPPGQISKVLITAIEKALKNKKSQIILVKGEEDLAVIPVVLLSPLGANVLYGQPDKGVVLIKVALEIKNKLFNLLN